MVYCDKTEYHCIFVTSSQLYIAYSSMSKHANFKDLLILIQYKPQILIKLVETGFLHI
jgi:hypothetical protein